ncbi:hypothetical protein LTR85_003448 [Meristemomyces frigidus]|nr:hypothetical protein LTR85_003448 [Meristemomyces frigidus]
MNYVQSAFSAELDLLPRATRFFLPFVAQTANGYSILKSGPLVVDSLDNEPQYVALAHRWSYEDARKSLDLNGAVFTIDENLHRGIVRTTQQHPNVAMWMDAISINMGNLSERSHQVRMMSDIFKQAEYVIAWLGDDEPPYEDAVSQVLSAASDGDFAANHLVSLSNIFAWLFSKPFWDRLWVCQEILLARKAVIQCGPCSIPLLQVLQAGDNIATAVERQVMTIADWECSANLSAKRAFKIGGIIQKVRGMGKREKLPEMLYVFRHQECTEPRDRFYSMIAMIDDAEKDELDTKIDYAVDKNVTLREMTLSLVRKSGAIDLLSTNNVDIQSSSEAWPQWMPQWDQEIYDYPLAPGVFDPSRKLLYHAFDDAPAQAAKPSVLRPGTLESDVLSLGSVSSTIPISDPNTMSVQLSRATVPWQPCTTFGHQETLSQALHRTILEDRIMFPPDTFVRLDPRHSGATGFVGGYSYTDGGKIGNGPRGMEVGDEIVVFPGAYVPHVVRRGVYHRRGTYDYRLIGEW